MTHTKILGTGCASCKATQKLIEEVIASKALQAQVDKVANIPLIMKY
ncbi:thioredoxin family protein [Candidatus Igneacidithiobacillus taiwanensis]|nr:thioredoxin family protein [Candidatus Igneacidithiobacillus taiwanensis]